MTLLHQTDFAVQTTNEKVQEISNKNLDVASDLSEIQSMFITMSV